MQLSQPLIKGKLVERYKRFLANIELEDGSVVTAHCANPGSMLGLNHPGSDVWISPTPNGSKRKLPYSWELVKVGGALIGLNTLNANKLARGAIEAQLIPELADYNSLRAEVKYGNNSRVDFVLEDNTRPRCYVEVKNVHLRRNDLAEFPDSVTKRGTKHLYELIEMVKQGNRAVLFYVVQRNDCDSFAVAADIDPDYAKASKEAKNAGVEIICYSCDITLGSIKINKQMNLA